jgi:hypothetical protein
MTLTEFLLARIAEDQAWARAREREDFRHHRMSVRRLRHPEDPVRVMADCVAKRRIVERCDSDHGLGRVVLAELAAVYANHPDYRDEWRP